MCEANAYLMKDGEERLVLESVDVVEPDGPDAWLLVNIFGEQKVVRGSIRTMNLVDHRIVFEAPAA